MITLDDDKKAKLSNLLNSDGKIIITDDMPEDLKSCIKYLNENNVNLFSGSDPNAYVEDYEADPFAPGASDDETDDSSDEALGDEDVELEEDEEIDTLDDKEVEDLNDIF